MTLLGFKWHCIIIILAYCLFIITYAYMCVFILAYLLIYLKISLFILSYFIYLINLYFRFSQHVDVKRFVWHLITFKCAILRNGIIIIKSVEFLCSSFGNIL